MLPLDSGPKLAVGQVWLGDLGVGGNSVSCLIMFAIFTGLGRAYRLGDILKIFWIFIILGRGQAKKGWEHFYGES